MNSFPASVRADCGPDRVDQAVRLLDDERRRRGTVEIENVWARCRAAPAGAAASADFLADLVKADLRRRFDLGETPQVADYLERLPELKGVQNRLVSLIYEEYCLHEEQGQAPDVASFCARYPDWKDSLLSQLEYHRLFSQATGNPATPPRFPRPGEDFEEFQLVSLLGEGGASRVFLARDLSLGGKQVVLKVAIDRGDEPKLQGRLDHPHIVPVNSVAFAPDRGLVGLSMPLQPGLPLDVVIARLDPASRPKHARAIWNVLVDGASRGLIPSASGEFGAMLRDEISRAGPRGDRWHGFPKKGTYAQGVAWIIMTVARALQYAHSMATFHRDVKPANVLLTLAHGPQLLDFNLAESPHSADRAHEAFRGGTLPYMAPEQIQAFLNPDLWGSVGAAADVYSLGLVLREMLTGIAPEPPAPDLKPPRAMLDVLDRRAKLDPSVRTANPACPHALDAIVKRALAFDPAARYPDARSLAVDLECFLKRKPLLQAVNTSRREHLVNWSIRRGWIVGGAAGFVLASSLALYRPIVDRMMPRVESLAAFQSAVAAIEAGDGPRALAPLLQLEKDYPSSSLVKLYLTLVLDAGERPFEAEERYRAALAATDLESSVAPWAKQHPDLAHRLEDFAAHKYDIAYLDDEDASIAQARVALTRVARDGLLLAESLNPDSPVIERRLARVETLLQEFPRAIDRLSRSIEYLESRSDAESVLADLYFSRLQRVWASVAYVDHARDQGILNAQSALEILSRAETDLAFCSRFMATNNFEDKPLKKKFYLLRNTLRVFLSMAEIELASNHPALAERHLKRAQSADGRFNELARELNRPSNENLRFGKRLEDDLKKLHTLGVVRSKSPATTLAHPESLSQSG